MMEAYKFLLEGEAIFSLREWREYMLVVQVIVWKIDGLRSFHEVSHEAI